jgi:hypothetical protein
MLASLILTTAYSSGRFDITNQFFQSSIKRRITMITKNKDPRFSYLRRIAALFVLLVTLGMLAFRAKNVNNEVVVKPGITDTMPHSNLEKLLVSLQNKGADTVKVIYKLNDKKIYAADIKKIPAEKIDAIITSEEKHADGDMQVVNIITKNAKDEIVIRGASNPIYIVDGKEIPEKDFKSIDPNDIFSVSVWKGEKAIDKFGERGKSGVIDVVTKKSRDGKPSIADTVPKRDAALAQPVPDKASDTAKLGPIVSDNKMVFRAETIIVADNKDEVHPLSQANQPLYLLDGKEVTDIKSINSNDIESITVWKDKHAIERYGDKGKNGVIDIRTKKATKPTSLTP